MGNTEHCDLTLKGLKTSTVISTLTDTYLDRSTFDRVTE